MVERGKPTHVAMALTGHKTLESFEKYIYLNRDIDKKVLNDLWDR